MNNRVGVIEVWRLQDRVRVNVQGRVTVKLKVRDRFRVKLRVRVEVTIRVETREKGRMATFQCRSLE